MLPSSNFKRLYGLLYSSAWTWHICKRLTRLECRIYIFKDGSFTEARIHWHSCVVLLDVYSSFIIFATVLVNPLQHAHRPYLNLPILISTVSLIRFMPRLLRIWFWYRLCHPYIPVNFSYKIFILIENADLRYEEKNQMESFVKYAA